MVKKVEFYGIDLELYKFFNCVEFSADEQIEMKTYRDESILSPEQVLSGIHNLIQLENQKAQQGEDEFYYVYYDELKMSPYSSIHFYDKNGLLLFTYPWNGQFKDNKPVRTSTRDDIVKTDSTEITKSLTFSLINADKLLVEAKQTIFNKFGEVRDAKEAELVHVNKLLELEEEYFNSLT